ncbi:MAG: hypothetical protein HQK96_06595 [Nitrospirae bacterium]|nr:hypothetical protein [Nitrospirota bacterium]
MNRDYNPKRLRDLDRVCIYRCNNCHRIFLLPFDAKDSKTSITCKGCERYIDADKDIVGDSWYPNEFPEVKFTISDNSFGKDMKPLLQVWFHMECRDCHKLSWIVWRGRLFDYNTCICHESVKEEAEPEINITAKPIAENIVIDKFIIPADLVSLLKDYCFEHDTNKKDAIIEALRHFLDKNNVN